MVPRRSAVVVTWTTALVAAGAAWVGVGPGREATAQPAPACNMPTTDFCNAVVQPPANWHGHVFELSQAYPTAAPNDAQPWAAFNPRTQPDQYIKAVLAHFYEGNLRPDVEMCFEPKLNTVRGWYNAPWQDFGTNGREPIHGLTRERVSRPFELDPHQSRSWNNYAVGFYNAPGAVTIGRVWADRGRPNPAFGSMPNGTVAAKLLFTTAPVSEVPYLQGAPTWNAYVYADANDPAPGPTSPRAVLPVRLLQIDIAVKDPQVADVTGWVFGTFVYGGGPGGQPGAGWTNVAPVGVMWGNDPGYPGSGPLIQTSLNPAVHMPHVGFQGRLNGPVDNAASSCLSCHATAEAPAGTMVPPHGADPAPWFQNLRSGTPFDPGRQALDYSLQVSVGLSNFAAAQALARSPSPAARHNLLMQMIRMDARPPRDGGAIH
ncbi:hypothetical protein [Methylobacterium durans]|uniref:Cytochrome c domain-containing protein n=1 Tax=Methylobacterium durans TaxID=2202825 RepID=A0A2U8WB41_9HYPH|nr:hypothetical protein [Methylobacterium durans]AWN42512.1 hypothetical protein DK389_20925 [Methylobacterium durans]